MTVRDPAEAIGRLTRWNSWTDGESPEGRRTRREHAGRRPGRVPAAAPLPAHPGAPCDRTTGPEERRDGDPSRDRGHEPRPRCWPRLRASRPARTPGSAASCWGPTATSSPRATTAAPAPPMPRWPPWPRRGTGPRREHGSRHPRAVQPHRPHRAVRAGARRRRRGTAWSSPRPTLSPVASGGADALRAAGVDVEGGLLADEAERLNPFWTFATTAGRPFVTLKTAATLDGRVAAADGTSRWITSPQSRADVHRLRAEVDAVVVGTGTVLADDPALTAREGGSDGRELPPAASAAARGRRHPRAAGGMPGSSTAPPRRSCCGPGTRRRCWPPWPAVTSSTCCSRAAPPWPGAFVAAGLVDRVVAYVAPMLLGEGRAALGPGRHQQHRRRVAPGDPGRHPVRPRRPHHGAGRRAEEA